MEIGGFSRCTLTRSADAWLQRSRASRMSGAMIFMSMTLPLFTSIVAVGDIPGLVQRHFLFFRVRHPRYPIIYGLALRIVADDQAKMTPVVTTVMPGSRLPDQEKRPRPRQPGVKVLADAAVKSVRGQRVFFAQFQEDFGSIPPAGSRYDAASLQFDRLEFLAARPRELYFSPVFRPVVIFKELVFHSISGHCAGFWMLEHLRRMRFEAGYSSQLCDECWVFRCAEVFSSLSLSAARSILCCPG